MVQNRFKSKYLWAAIAAQVLAILMITGIIDTALSTQIEQVITGLLQILVMLGILNNPTDGVKW